MYACRNCPYRTEAANPLVFRNDLKLISKVCRHLRITLTIRNNPVLLMNL